MSFSTLFGKAPKPRISLRKFPLLDCYPLCTLHFPSEEGENTLKRKKEGSQLDSRGDVFTFPPPWLLYGRRGPCVWFQGSWGPGIRLQRAEEGSGHTDPAVLIRREAGRAHVQAWMVRGLVVVRSCKLLGEVCGAEAWKAGWGWHDAFVRQSRGF